MIYTAAKGEALRQVSKALQHDMVERSSVPISGASRGTSIDFVYRNRYGFPHHLRAHLFITFWRYAAVSIFFSGRRASRLV